MTHVRQVMHNVDFVYQLLLRATKLVSSGRQSAVALLIKEAAVDEGEGPLGRLVTEIRTGGPSRLGTDRPSDRSARGSSRSSSAGPDGQQVVPTSKIAFPVTRLAGWATGTLGDDSGKAPPSLSQRQTADPRFECQGVRGSASNPAALGAPTPWVQRSEGFRGLLAVDNSGPRHSRSARSAGTSCIAANGTARHARPPRHR
jgi:hypothetical protein